MIKLQKTTDFQVIFDLASKIWKEHYVPIIGEQQIDYMLKKFYSEAAFEQQNKNGQFFYLIDNQSITEGFLAITQQSEDSLFLNKFYVDGRGKGIGQKSFQSLLAMFPNIQNIRLQVNKKNFKSINFYFKVGFQIEDIAVFDIGEGYVMDDFLMVWQKNNN